MLFFMKNFVTCHITPQTGSIPIRREESSMKENSVSVKLMRLRKKLRKKLEKEGVVL